MVGNIPEHRFSSPLQKAKIRGCRQIKRHHPQQTRPDLIFAEVEFRLGLCSFEAMRTV